MSYAALDVCRAVGDHPGVTAIHVIVGAGQAGGWAAIAMRQAGFTGRVLLVGDERWRPYERPPLSKAMLAGEPEPPVLFFHEQARYAELAIELLLGAAVEELDAAAHRIRLHGGTSLPYDKMLLATGGRARRLPLPGAEHVHLLRTIEDARAIRTRLASARRVICIGAGVIGLEIASSARGRGCEVTVLEAGPIAMGRCVSIEGARFIEALHRSAGVELRFEASVEAVEAQPDGSFQVICNDGVLAADCVIAGIGMQRNLDLAAGAGLAIDGGIMVDELGRTDAPGIYAAGDVAAFLHPHYRRRLRLESWRHAQNHGIAVGRVMAGEALPYDDIPWFWTDQHGVNLQVAGLPAEAARTVVRINQPPVFVAVHLAADDAVVGVTAAGSPRDIRAGTALIKARKPIDPVMLADPAVPLQRLLGR
ncbi:MAG TPA: FAD-dependent oxidoreductase [Acetobacteraceae bacterium]|nr:FAD-dependent oxidoreductase [Acetobacteraceae bacterium]